MTEKKKSRLKKIWQWISLRLKTRKKLISAIHESDFIVHSGVLKLASLYRRLRQDRVYAIIVAEDEDIEAIESLNFIWKRAGELVKWTLPTMLIINRPLKEISDEELEYFVLSRGGIIVWGK